MRRYLFTVAFRQIINGTPRVEISAEPTLPSLGYVSPVSPLLGVAVANPSSSTVSVSASVRDSNGNLAGQFPLTLAANTHTAFNLNQKLPGLSADFTGTLTLDGVGANDTFIAWTLNGDGSVISSLPPGRLAWPISHQDQIVDAFVRIWGAAQSFNASGALPSGTSFGSQPPTLNIQGGQVANAAANGSMLMVTLGLSQLISDSPSELGFAIGHEMGHVFQFRNGGMTLFDPNIEFDADIWGIFLSLFAGYDPYGAAGTLGKLAMATGTAGLIQQFEAATGPDLHSSFNQRLESIFTKLVLVCSASSVQPFCQLYKTVIHPNLPPIAPLARPSLRR